MRKAWPFFAGMVVLVLAAAAGAGPRAFAEDPPEAGAPAEAFGTVRIDARLDVDPVGNAKASATVAFRAEDFGKVKASAEDPKKWLQDLKPSRADYEIAPGATAVYDDARSAIVLALTELGAAKNRGEGRWEIAIDPGMEPKGGLGKKGGRPVAVFVEKGTWDSGVKYENELEYLLPAGATGAEYDAGTRVLAWTLPYAGGTGEGRLAHDLKTKDRLMASIYKVYGLGADFAAQWVAKSVWRNAGGNVVRNLKVRYQLAGYSDWSGWDKFPEVVPGQTVVSLYYPVLSAAIAKLRTNAPADVRVEWKWEDAQGKSHEDDETKRLTLLGVNEFVFSNLVQGESFGTFQEDFNNAPLLAAWVSRNDPIVHQMAAMANRLAGGVGALTDDESALKVLRACYDLLRANDFTYQHPPTLADRSVSFDLRQVQNVKFPRDVVRNRSGTCIDLAILYAAMANSIGLDPYLALIPGHCFPFVKLPGGNLFAVETTGVGGGIRYGSLDFDRATAIGNQELANADADGRIHVIKVRDNWTRGISNPELEDFPPDILEKWGIKEEGRGTPSGPVPPASVPQGLDAILGVWGGSMSAAKLTDDVTLDAMYVGVERDAAGRWKAGLRLEVTGTANGASAQGVVTCIYENGRADGSVVRFPAVKMKRTNLSTGEEVEIDGNPLALRPSGDGRLEGALEGDGGFTFTLAPKKDEAAPGPAPAPGALAGLVGSWGGGMGGADIGSGVKLDEMYVDVAHDGGGWTATTKMVTTVPALGGTRVVIDVVQRNGRVEGDSVRFEKTPWQRTVPATGQKDQIEGNPLVLKLTTDGRLSGVFEGSDGMPFTLLRRGAAPAAPAGPDPLLGTWEGTVTTQTPNGPQKLQARAGFDPKEGGGFTGAIRVELEAADAAGNRKKMAVIEFFDGAREGNGYVFRGTKAVVKDLATGEEKPASLDGMTLSLEGGRLSGRVGNDDEGWSDLAMTRSK